ncbi:DUF1176 domain-containing protein [Stenotrophomonas geniculata]|uniref:DUF1176 domain-containing protein n=1 Tax=Stenotrophomonas geniculata TaxID=86188 RepID=UPI002E75D7D0|nr:DUF1176 domain-containing protein [Stenotrophomonas geniculata]
MHASSLLCTPLLLASLTMASVAPAAEPAGISLAKGDGVMACDNTRTCRLAAYGPLAPLMLSALIERSGGPRTAVTARLSMAEGGEDAPATPAPVAPEGTLRLHVDGKDLGAIGHSEALDSGLELPTRYVTAMIEALLAGKRVEMSDASGHAWPLSDRGIRTLLLKMDEAQGRLDTPGALVRKGSQPESKVPAAVAAPPLKAPPLLAEAQESDAQLAERADLLQQLQPVAAAGNACDRMSSRQLRIERVDASHVLALLNCTTDRYIVPAGTWLIRDRPPFSPTLIAPSTLFPLYPHAVFLEEGVVTDTNACGTNRHWAWDGSRLVLSATYLGDSCSTRSRRHWALPTYVTDLQ